MRNHCIRAMLRRRGQWSILALFRSSRRERERERGGGGCFEKKPIQYVRIPSRHDVISCEYDFSNMIVCCDIDMYNSVFFCKGYSKEPLRGPSLPSLLLSLFNFYSVYIYVVCACTVDAIEESNKRTLFLLLYVGSDRCKGNVLFE